MADDLVAHLTDLAQLLNDLDGRTVTVHAASRQDEPLTEREARHVHDALLKLKRSGRLGLNDD